MIDSYKNSGQCITLSINIKDVVNTKHNNNNLNTKHSVVHP